MSKKKLNSIVEQQISESTEFWAGKSKLSNDELIAIEQYAKNKVKAFDEFCSTPQNVKNINEMFTKALKK